MSVRRESHKIILLVFLLAGFFINNFIFAETKTVRVGYVDVAGYEEGLDGEYKTGFGYEYLQQVSYYTNWKYEYVYGSFSELILKLSTGDIDLLGNVTYMPERAKTMSFSSYPQGSEGFFIFTTASNFKLLDGNAKSLENKKIGVGKGSYQSELIKNWTKSHNITASIIELNGTNDLIKRLDSGDLDAIVITDAANGYGYVPVQHIGFNDYYFAVTKNRPDLLQELDDAMYQIQSANPNYNTYVKTKYVNEIVGSTYLDEKEKNWLKNKNNTINIGYLDNNLPYSDMDQNGQLVGTLSLLTKKLSDQFDITVKAINYKDSDALTKALDDKEIDILGPCFCDFYLTECLGTIQTNPILTTIPIIIYKGDKVNLDKIAVTSKSLFNSDVVKIFFPKSQLYFCENEKACLNAVKTGKANATITNLGRLNFYPSLLGYSYSEFVDPVNIGFITAESEACTIMNKTIALASENIKRLGYRESKIENDSISLGTAIKSNLPFFFVFFTAITVILVFLLILAYISKKSAHKSKKEAEQALVQAENANKAKSAFLFNMSHDIRTPMNAIMGFTRLASGVEGNPVITQSYLGKIDVAGKSLLGLINNVLEMARIENGAIQRKDEIIDISLAIPKSLAIFEGIAKENKIKLTGHSDIYHKYIYEDENIDGQVALNIISNAMKYTPEGGSVDISLTQKPGLKEDECSFEFVCKDTGIGMSKEFLEHAFDNFSREQTSTVSKIQGAGLGLGIVKKLVDFCGGTINIESTQGVGTTVTVKTYHKMGSEEDLKKREEQIVHQEIQKLENKQILLVEDNDLNAEIAIAILEGYKLKVDWVEDGFKCLEKLKSEPSDKYDLILMDVQMPKMNGYETTEQIRSLELPLCDIPILAMTANAFEEDKKKALDCGMNGHIAKPINIEELVNNMVAFVRG